MGVREVRTFSLGLSLSAPLLKEQPMPEDDKQGQLLITQLKLSSVEENRGAELQKVGTIVPKRELSLNEHIYRVFSKRLGIDCDRSGKSRTTPKRRSGA